MTRPPASCATCVHLGWDDGSPAYSEWTPAEPPMVWCKADRTRLPELDSDFFRSLIRVARDCDSYVPATSPAAEGGAE